MLSSRIISIIGEHMNTLDMPDDYLSHAVQDEDTYLPIDTLVNLAEVRGWIIEEINDDF